MSSTVVSAKQTWRKIKQKVIRPTVTRLDVELGNLRSGEFVRYREWVMSHVGQLPLNGFSQRPFHTCFVEPLLSYERGPSAPRQKLPRWLRNDPQAMPQFLANSKIHKHHLLVTGEPGMGKTTLLRQMAWRWAQDGLGDPLVLLPFLLVAQPLAETLLRHPDRTLAQLIQEQLRVAGFTMQLPWLTEQLQNGRCLLLFDGLDEIVNPEAWMLFLGWLDEQSTLFKKSQFVATTRPYIGNSDQLADWTALALQPFSLAQQQQFMQQWGLKDGESWLAQLPTLARQPFLLTLLVQLQQQERPLPTSEQALIGEFCTQQLIDGRQYDPVSQVLDAHLRRYTLSQVAHEMMRQRKLYMTDEELVRLVGEGEEWLVGSGLMVRTAVGLTRFAHSLLQSYLAATYVRANGYEKQLWARLDDRWWHDTIRLFSQEQMPEKLIARCLTATQPTVERLHLVHATLQAIGDVSPKLIENIPRLLWHNATDSNSLQQRLLAELMLFARFQRADMAAVEGGMLVTHVEYQLFVDAMQAHGRHTQPDHWLAYQFPKGQATRPVVGTRAVDARAFCNWLNERGQQVNALQFRLPFPGELNGRLYAQIGNQKGVAYWVNGSDSTHLELLTAPNPSAEVLERQLARDLSRAHVAASGAGFRFTEAVPLILDPARAVSLNVSEINVPPFDAGMVQALAVLEDYDLLARTDVHASDLAERNGATGGASTSAEANGRLAALADVVATVLQIPPEQAHKMVFNLPHTSDLAKQRHLESEPIVARQVIRFYALILAASLQTVWLLQRQYLTMSTDMLQRQRVAAWQQSLTQRIATYVDIYTDMVVLDERKAGNLQATESICLVGDPTQ